MNSKSMVFVVAAILAVAAVGIVINYGLLDNDSEAKYEVDFLFERNTGEKVWSHGSGDTPQDALNNACDKIGYELEYTGTGNTLWIDTIDGIGWVASAPEDTTKSGSSWVHYEWDSESGSWVATDYLFGNLPTGVKYFCFFYTDLDPSWAPIGSPTAVPA